MRLTLAEILDAANGELLAGSVKRPVERLCTDTRLLQPGDAFLALRGPNFDGEDFVAEAFARGAAGAIVSHARPWDAPTGDRFLIAVDDAGDALSDIARAWRRRVPARIAAITGSSGKTTTKEMAAHICRGSMRLHATEGNRNNHIGLPLTLLRLEEEHEAAILEAGMNHSGELARLASICEPSIGCVTNVGDAHIGNFHDGQDGVIAAKAELLEHMDRAGTALVNADCPNSAIMRGLYKLPPRVVSFGAAPLADVRASRIRRTAPLGYAFELHAFGACAEAHLPLFGRYQVHNALAAAAVASLLGVGVELIAERLATFSAPEMRSRVRVVAGVRVVEDCYNASPAATLQAIQSFREMAGEGRRFLLLGDMHELGGMTEERHRRVGAMAAEAEVAGIACVGERARWIADEAMKSHPGVAHFDRHEDAAAHLASVLAAGDALLAKGSRLARLERVLDGLQALLGAPAAEEAEA